MKSFSEYLKESIVDKEQETLSSQIFLNPDSESPTLKPKVIEKIKNVLAELDSFKVKIKEYTLMGSILTKRYTDEADLDVTVLIDATEEKLKEIRKALSKINGQFVPETKHPVNLFVTNSKQDYDKKKSLADGEFDIEKNKFVRKAVSAPFDVRKYWSSFQNAANTIDIAKGELKQDLKDYKQLKSISKVHASYLKKQIEDKLEDVESVTKELADLYEKIKQDRRDSFDAPMTSQDIIKYGTKNRMPENVLYKLLEKYHYLDFLHKIQEILGDDDKLSPQEAEELAQLLK